MLFPKDVSLQGHWIDDLFYLGLWLTATAFVAVLGILVVFLIKYRSKPGKTGYYTHGDSKKALWLTLALAFLVFIAIDINLAIHDHRAWEAVFEKPASSGEPLRVEVLAQQFAWNFRYAGPDGKFKTSDDITTMNQLHIPVNRPVLLQMQSKDVIHSFFIPNFRIKQDAVPGMVTMMTFEAVQEGKCDIACAEHCGLGHYRMRGLLSIDSEQDFEKFLNMRKRMGAPDLSWGWNWETRR